MQRVVSFYEKLPRGAAPAVKPKGLMGRYQARYFGKNASAARKYSSVESKVLEFHANLPLP
jgi:F-type H+-transporting ATPase subunit f